ncbi:MAG: hypothetical protein LBC39_02710 [Methanobrevibacter sp.]|jgi:hypothetical protein|nr:hypothetical protein [Candidatus Methanovirga aequatorialis]
MRDDEIKNKRKLLAKNTQITFRVQMKDKERFYEIVPKNKRSEVIRSCFLDMLDELEEENLWNK